MQLQLRWKLIRRRRLIDSGTGRTIDLSGGGILFEAGGDLQAGLNVELAIAWPVLLHDVAPMQMMAGGRIVRSGGGWAAIRTVTHQFRTAGIHADQSELQTNAAKAPGRMTHRENALATAPNPAARLSWRR